MFQCNLIDDFISLKPFIFLRLYIRSRFDIRFNLDWIGNWNHRTSHSTYFVLIIMDTFQNWRVQQAYHAATVIRQMQRLAFNSSSSVDRSQTQLATSATTTTSSPPATKQTTSSTSLQGSSDSSNSAKK